MSPHRPLHSLPPAKNKLALLSWQSTTVFRSSHRRHRRSHSTRQCKPTHLTTLAKHKSQIHLLVRSILFAHFAGSVHTVFHLWSQRTALQKQAQAKSQLVLQSQKSISLSLSVHQKHTACDPRSQCRPTHSL